MGNIYRLRWSRSTPFVAHGRLGFWAIRWRGEHRAYVITLNELTVSTAHTVTEAKRWAEHTDIGDKICECCHGTGWVSSIGK